jgi:hypothetical protein
MPFTVAATCGPRIAEANRFGSRAIKNGDVKDFPSLEEEYIILSPLP